MEWPSCHFASFRRYRRFGAQVSRRCKPLIEDPAIEAACQNGESEFDLRTGAEPKVRMSWPRRSL